MEIAAIVVNVILLICFFVMGSNIGTIKNTLHRMATSGGGGINYSGAYTDGEMQEYLGNNAAALECYNKAYYLLAKYMQKNKHGDLEAKNKKMIEDKIKALGGTVKPVS
jgi:hypothetical protein